MTMPNGTTVDDTDDETTEPVADEKHDDDTEEYDDTDDQDTVEDDLLGQPQKKGVRARLKDAESERDELRTQLDWTRQVAFLEACRAASVDSDLAAAKGLKATDYLDEHGAVDSGPLAEALERVRAEAGVPRRPRPLRSAGRADREQHREVPTFGQVLAEHGKRLRG
ncbi:hypothetical protein [Mycolicibacterium septicum]|uniref:hypothetical protein n=1 Tax=Mycolicibacterium septicum TaxID=98668 RepID=UPI001AFA21EC|nr:hypothetical protein [Mycolicibacterium septicum]QRY53388.1 hypothetical protein JVX95_08745 [Mycolicibacterium septicum]